MTVEQKVQAILVADAGVTAIVPADRISVQADLQNLALPYIIHRPRSGRTTECHDGPKALREWDYYELLVVAVKYSQARDICLAVEAALDGYYDADTDRIHMCHPPLPLDDYDTDRKLQAFALNFEIAGGLK